MNTALRFLLILYCAAIVSGCQSTDPLNNTSASAKVLVVNSNSALPRYSVPEQAFIKQMKEVELLQVDLANDEHPTETLQDTLNAHNVDAIYCIGAKALGSIDYLSPPAPVVYSSVLSWREFQNRAHFFGVTDGVAPAAQLAWFKHFFPTIKSIGILYSETSISVIEDAKQSAQALSLNLMTQELSPGIEREKQISAFIQSVDALWILPDPVVLDSEANTLQLFELAHRLQVPVFAYNPFFMDLGATLSINADLATTGRQAALMVQTLSQSRVPPNQVQFPAGSNVSLNLRNVKQYNMTLDGDALNSVSELLDK